MMKTLFPLIMIIVLAGACTITPQETSSGEQNSMAIVTAITSIAPIGTQVPSQTPTPLTSGILISDEINGSNLLRVDDGLEISDRSDCLPKNCAFRVWNILQQESLALTVSNSTLQLGMSIRSFQTAENANSHAEQTVRGNGGQPGTQMIEVPSETLPEQSWAYAEDGRFISLITVYGNIQINVSLSQYTGGINESEKAVVLLATLARMQIDKLARLSQR